jgi:hypothetical protein
MKRALQSHAEMLLAAELRRLPPEQRERVQAACGRVVAAVVDGVLDEARGEPRLAAVLESLYGPRSRISAWPAEAALRG